MSIPGRTCVITLALAALVTSGCGAEKKPGTTPAPATSATPTASPTPTPTPTASASATPTATTTPTACPTTGAGAVPDGTWAGPITMDVQGKGGGSGFGDTKGTGTLTMVIAGGTITRGSWKVVWRSVGHADTGQAAATIRLKGTIGGTVKGPASKPVLPGRWRISGTATITKPVHATQPVNETGTDKETMAIESTTCDQVTGTFLPSFNSKDAAATFTGTARWVGTQQN